MLPGRRVRGRHLLDHYLQMSQAAREALGQCGGDIGDGIVELLTTGAVTGQMRGDQIPAASPPPAIATTGAGTLTGRPGRGLLDIHDGTVSAGAVGCCAR